MTDDTVTANETNNANIWHCTQWYPSTDDTTEEHSVHTVTAHRRSNKWVLESVPDDTKSHMVVNMTLDNNLATGSWSENTLPEGDYEGITYSGALQLLVSTDGKKMEGMWVGVGRAPQADGSYQPKIYAGRWLMEQVA